MMLPFNAVTRKADDGDPFQRIPAAIYLDNGLANSAVFKRVMESLGVEILEHMPAGLDGRRRSRSRANPNGGQ